MSETIQRAIEADHFPEVAADGNGTRRLELLGIKESLREPDQRRALFASMSNDEYKKYIGYINSITRGEKVSDNYADGKLGFIATPSLEDKEMLMDKSFEAVRDILSDKDSDDEIALRRAGLTIAGAINYIHPYENGNGRSGRAMHYLVEFGNQRGDEIFDLEMSATIGKYPVYDGELMAIYDSPPPAMTRALDEKVGTVDVDPRQAATARVELFLDMMKGKSEIVINEPVLVHQAGSTKFIANNFVAQSPGTTSGPELYEQTYLGLSSTPNRPISTDMSDSVAVTPLRPAAISLDERSKSGVELDIL